MLRRIERRGLRRGLGLLGIRKEHLEVEGRISQLENDVNVESVSGTIFDRKNPYTVKLREARTKEEILNLLSRKGFPEPNFLTGCEEPFSYEADFIGHPFRYRMIFQTPQKPEGITPAFLRKRG